MSKEAMVRLIKHRDSCHDDWGDDGAWRTLYELRTMEADRFPEDLHDALKEFQALDEEAQYCLVYETLGITPETTFQVLPAGHTEEQLRAALRLLGLQIYDRPGKLIVSRVELDAADIDEIEKKADEAPPM